MYCSKCGKQLEENVAVCPECGTAVQAKNPILASLKENFMDKIFDYKGTMSVKDFWWFYLYASVISYVLFWCVPVLVWATLAVLSATARRLRDAGKSPLDMLWMLLFPGGVIAVIIWCTKPTGTYNK